jgi:hypothetical protein
MFTFPFPSPADASIFDPDSVRILSGALDDAWQSLHDAGTTLYRDSEVERTRRILARCIIEVAKLGERDRHRLRDAALAHLAEANVRK